VATDWAAQDSQAALSWVQGLPPSPAKNNPLQNVARNLAQSDPQGGLALLQSPPSASSRNNVQQQIVEQWSRDDPQTAADYVSNQLAGSDRQAALVLAQSITSPKDKADAFSKSPAAAK